LNLNAVSENYQELSPSWQHDTVLHKARDGGHTLQMWGVAANILISSGRQLERGDPQYLVLDDKKPAFCIILQLDLDLNVFFGMI
jgi:hypothetical protein